MDKDWPKKLSAGKFCRRWYADLCTKTICNRIESGALPGIKEGGKWFVWVNYDMTPAYDYLAPSPDAKLDISPKAQSIVDGIMDQYKAS